MTDPDPEIKRVRLTVTSNPFGHDPPYASEFYTAIGRIVLLWGRLENQTDLDRLAANIDGLSTNLLGSETAQPLNQLADDPKPPKKR